MPHTLHTSEHMPSPARSSRRLPPAQGRVDRSVAHVFVDDTTHSLAAVGHAHQALCAAPPGPSRCGMLLHTCQRIEWYTACEPSASIPALGSRPPVWGRRRALTRLAQIAAGTRSLVLGERFIHRQVVDAAGRLPADHPLFQLGTDALRLAEQAREKFDLHADVDYSDLPRLLLTPHNGSARRLLVIGGGMLARAVAAAPPAGYERVLMLTRGPRKLRRLVEGLGNVTVVRAPSLATALDGRPYDTVIATTNLHPDYRRVVADAASSPLCGGVVDLCCAPAVDRREGYHHLYDPEVLHTLARANRDMASRAADARRWITQRAEVTA